MGKIATAPPPGLDVDKKRDFFHTLFYFATRLDVALTIFGCLCKLVFGSLQVMILIVFSDFFDMSNTTADGFYDQGVQILVNMCYFGIGTAAAEAAGSTALEYAKHRQITLWKKEYLKSILRQDVGWYDLNRPQELSTRMGESLVHIEKGLHSSNGNIFSNTGQLLGGLIVAHIYAWDIALVTLAVAILTYIPAVTLLLHYLDMRTRILADAYAAAGGVASEVLSSLRTVASLGLEGKMLARYDTHLVTAERASISLSRKIFLALSTMNSSMFYVMAAGALFAIWRLVNEYRDTEFDYVYDNNVTYCANRCDPYDPLQVESAFLSSLVDAQTACADRGPEFVPFRMTCNSGETITGSGNATLAFWTLFSGLTGQARLDSFLDRFDSAGSTAKCTIGLATIYVSTQAVFQGVMGASQIASPVTALTKAATACREVLRVISRIPPIDSFTEDGLKPEHVRGEIEVRDVWFAYPSSPSFHICQGYNLSIPAGSSCALVGPSGSGKSTIVQLLERYYDPLSGSILLDGIDLKEYNVKALRSKIGMVAQEPMLFLGTVAENIALGKPGATREEVEAAARAANAYDFITQNLNDGFDTQVGLGGGKLSGGQKQRVAIARAIIKAPSILMLDEATSALDNASEKVVQASLDAIMQRSSYTSITIAHRLSTIKYSDMIAVVKKGVIVEKGTYDELLAVGEGGAFFELANRQNLNAAKDEETMRATEARKSGPGEPSTPGSPGSPGGPRPGDSSAVEELDLEGGKKHKKKEKKPDSLSRLLRMSPKSDRWLYAVGIACALITGVGKGMFGLLFIRSLTALGPASPDKIASEGIFWAIVFLLVGLGMHACELLFNMCLGVTGEHLTKALRHNMMGKLLTQEIGYFDQESNTMGALTEFLGEKVVLINGLVGERLGMIAQSVTMLVTVIFTMFYWGDWRVTLLVLGCFPVMGVAMAVAMAAMMPMDQGKQGKKDKDADAKKSAGSMVGEVVLGIRTVASFNAEVKFYNDYCETMDAMLAKGKRRSFYGGSIAGLAFGLIFVIFGLEIFYGLYLASVGALFSFELEVGADGCVNNNMGTYMDKIMVPIMAMMMVMMMTSAMAMMATDAKSAQYAATELFDRIDRTSLIDPSDTSGDVLSSVAGKIEMRDVHFAYPTSLDQPVCRGYSLKIDAGMVCALCGPSGSGKSTVVALLQRFYDPQSGNVLLDGVDVRSLNLKWLRRQIGLVGQEPVLFEGTVTDNIAYGKAGATHDEIEEAARLANAHAFIVNDLGDGYETQVGLRGSKLSGGQKQRVAIARALVRKPAIMLLDEATSALDNESEKVVQAALDELMTKQKRTTITIAHRLSTIRNADKIAVVNRGKVVEQGSHDDLLQVGPSGLYFQLVAAQQ